MRRPVSTWCTSTVLLTDPCSGVGGAPASAARAVQVTRSGGPQILEVVHLPDPTPGEGQQLFDVSTAGVHHADTHHGPSREADESH